MKVGPSLHAFLAQLRRRLTATIAGIVAILGGIGTDLGQVTAADINVGNVTEFRAALLTAATNGEDDNIFLADGNYETTSDQNGTFKYLSNEPNSLRIVGSSSAAVVLSGGNTDPIFFIKSLERNTVYLEGITIKNGTNQEGYMGSLIEFDTSLNVSHSKIENRHSTFASFYSNCIYGRRSSIAISDTEFDLDAGRAIFLTGYYCYLSIARSKFISGSTDPVIDYSVNYNSADIYDSIFEYTGSEGNSVLVRFGTATNDGPTRTLYNSIIKNGAVNFFGTGKNRIFNSILLSEQSEFNVSGSTGKLIDIQNSYVDESKINLEKISLNNIYDNVNLGFVNQSASDYRLQVNSDLIDAGQAIRSADEFDMDSNSRVSGAGVDIGPYEFQIDTPIIRAVTHSGIEKPGFSITFSTDYILASGRTLKSLEYSYLNDGIWTANSTYTFSVAGIYKVKARVTDDLDQTDTSEISLTIYPLSDDDKLIQYIYPQHYDEAMEIITRKKDAARDAGFNAGVVEGKQYVVDNPADFGLYTEDETYRGTLIIPIPAK